MSTTTFPIVLMCAVIICRTIRCLPLTLSWHLYIILCLKEEPTVSCVFDYKLHICQPNFIIFGRKFETKEHITNPPYMVYVTALPGKILITMLVMFTVILVHSKCKIIIIKLYFRTDSRK